MPKPPTEVIVINTATVTLAGQPVEVTFDEPVKVTLGTGGINVEFPSVMKVGMSKQFYDSLVSAVAMGVYKGMRGLKFGEDVPDE